MLLAASLSNRCFSSKGNRDARAGNGLSGQFNSIRLFCVTVGTIPEDCPGRSDVSYLLQSRFSRYPRIVLKEQQPEQQNAPRGRPFVAGQSGNPAGRQKGSRNRSTLLAQSLLDGDAEELMRSAIDRAKAGDAVALRLCIERLVPARRAGSSTVAIDLPSVRKAEDLAEAAAAVIASAAAGELSMYEARAWLPLLERQRAIVETAELAVRLEVLEAGERERAAREKRRRS